MSSVDACLESIRRRPEMYTVVHEGYRRSLIRRFPYAVLYEQSEATVTIYAVFHTSRDPDVIVSPRFADFQISRTTSLRTSAGTFVAIVRMIPVMPDRRA